MLSYIAHIPHSPVLLPNIARHKFRNFKKIALSIEEIAKDIKEKKCDAIITITPEFYGTGASYVMNVCPVFEASFHKFGDFSTKETAQGDPVLAYYMRNHLGTKYALMSVSKERLDSPSAMAVMHLKKFNEKYSILPISHAKENFSKLFEFGKDLREALELSGKKIAVISLGDLSRASEDKKTQARKMDQEIMRYLQDKDSSSLINKDASQIDSFFIRALRPLALVLGLLDGINYAAEILQYDQKHGIGFMSARFSF